MSDINQELINLIKEDTAIITKFGLNQKAILDAITSSNVLINELAVTQDELLQYLKDIKKTHNSELYTESSKEILKILSGEKYNFKDIIYNVQQYKLVDKIRNFIIFISILGGILAIIGSTTGVLSIINYIKLLTGGS